MSLRYVPLLAGAAALSLLLAACAAPSVDTSSESDASGGGSVSPAETCDQLVDQEIIDATRSFFEFLTPEQFDQLLVECEENPDLLTYDVADSVVESASYVDQVNETFSVTDKDGYTFDLDVDFALVSVDEDPSTQKPGLTAASSRIQLDMTLVNTTSERQITFDEVSGIVEPLGYPTFLFAAYYAPESAACYGNVEGGGCVWLLGFGRMESGLTIPAGGSYPLTTFAGAPNYGAVLWESIPEDEWPEFEEALENPERYFIRYSGANPSRFEDVCGDADTQMPDLVTTAPCN